MVVVISLLLGITLLFFVVYPLIQPLPEIHYPVYTSDTKEELLATLNEIEFDYQMGKLDHQDYHNLKRHYERLAIQKIREEEEEVDSGLMGGREHYE